MTASIAVRDAQTVQPVVLAEDHAPDRRVLVANGNEAVAWAALTAGVRYFSHYPGSPVNTVEPALRRIAREERVEVVFNDALNEHVAALAAAGASFCGLRSMVVMKHVGLNVAADPLNYVGYTGVKGGMVVVVGTDPGANASTGEEDVHWYVPMMNLPLFEPTSAMDAFRSVCEAFELSERYQLPVLVYLPVRLCYGADFIEVPRRPPAPAATPRFEKDVDRYINVGARACRNHQKLVDKIESMGREVERCRTFFSPRAEVGLVTRGVTFGHVHESIERLGLQERVHLLQLDLVHPLPHAPLLEFLRSKKQVVVVEDQDGFLENQLKATFFNDVDCRIEGKEHFPRVGEVGFSRVHAYLADKFGVAPAVPQTKLAPLEVPERLGAFCEGCPHRGTYYAIEKALERRDAIIGGDIGCSSLPPFRADWLLCMNAGIGVAQGMAHVLREQTVVSTGGDGSFFHAGLLSLQSAVRNRIDLIHLVLDNHSVAMTGHQASPTSDGHFDHHALLKAIGVDRVIDVSGHHPTRFAEKLRAELGRTGVRVFWVDGRCARQPGPLQTLLRKTRQAVIEAGRCGSCTVCYDRFGCPAIERTAAQGLYIDPDRCARCGTCLDLCPNGAIETTFTCSAREALAHGLDFLRRAPGKLDHGDL